MNLRSPAVEIRQVPYKEYVVTGRAVADYAFSPSPRPRDIDELLKNEKYYTASQALVAFVDGQPQASMSNHDMTQNVRGTVVRMGGVGAVASMPAARRRGMVRQLFLELYCLQREMGMPVSTLYPFRDSFYERLGYASFPKPRYLIVKPETLTPLVRMDKAGACEQVSIRDGFDAWHGYLEHIQASTHGFSLRHLSAAVRWKDADEWWVAFARHEGDIVGAMTFRITGYTEKLEVSTFYTTSVQGRYHLLDWIGRHTDQVAEAQIKLRPDDYPEAWFGGLNATVSTHLADTWSWPSPMGRVVDVSLLSGIGAGDGEIALAIRDEHCPWNEGTFTFTGSGGTLSVTEGGQAAATITVQGLSALVFSGHDPATFAFRGWGDPDTAAREALRSIFPPVIPDMHETF